MSAFAKKSKAGSQTSRPQTIKQASRPFFDQSPETTPFFQKQPEAADAIQDAGAQPSSAMQVAREPRPGSRMESISSGRAFGGVNRVPSDAKWRVPPSADLQAILSSGAVDESVVHSRVRRLLERMHREGRLNSATSATDIGVVMDEIFPMPGQLDQAAY